MNYDEFVAEEKALEAAHSKFFSAGKSLSDYILIVFNMRDGYKRYEWIDEKGLPEDVRSDVKEFIARLEETKK
jgi:hypothetical protein